MGVRWLARVLAGEFISGGVGGCCLISFFLFFFLFSFMRCFFPGSSCGLFVRRCLKDACHAMVLADTLSESFFSFSILPSSDSMTSPLARITTAP
ncbi:hypothetical protein BC567DRAFT_76762 [Phyllosticta citribraziliensis]